MIISTLRFGEIEVRPTQVFHMTEPPAGISDDEFALISEPATEPIQWLQSTTSPEVCLPVADPLTIRQNYNIEIPPQDCEDIGLKRVQDALVLTIVVLRPDPAEIRTNLRAPIVFNMVDRKAKQVILNDNDMPIKYYFLGKDSEHCNKEVANAGADA